MKTDKEIRILQNMIEIYCTGMKHSRPCCECSELFSYAKKRSISCPHKDTEVFCSTCEIHCYDERHREKIREVMRYSSRNYFLKHPFRTMSHLLSVLRKIK